ncbi:MAG: glycosyltransferase [Pseudonocardiaceae bacterium]|nr:glycosyltransferase [Pseudonocardiaceae bacterium]
MAWRRTVTASKGVRVAIVTESFLPQVNGVSNSVLRVVEHLTGAGHAVLVVAPGTGPADYHGAEVIRVPAVDLPVVNSLPIGLPTRKLTTALADFAPDVVHLASPFVVGAGGLRAARQLGVPTVAVYQTDVAGFASSYGLGIGYRAAWRWTSRLHARADRTLAPSSSAAAALAEHGVPRVYRWGRGVDVHRFHHEHRDRVLRAELAPGGQLLVGYVGRLAAEKQLERLVALNGQPGVRLVLTGDGPQRDRLAERLPGAVFLGPRYGADLARVYASLDVFVHTGSHETFCQTVQEAMASGIPVLAPDSGGPRDLVEDGETGYLLPAGEPDFGAALVDRVARLADPALRTRLGRAGRNAVAARSWPAICTELVEHYRAVMRADERAA